MNSQKWITKLLEERKRVCRQYTSLLDFHLENERRIQSQGSEIGWSMDNAPEWETIREHFFVASDRLPFLHIFGRQF
jgi:hypothetical protein